MTVSTAGNSTMQTRHKLEINKGKLHVFRRQYGDVPQ